MHSYLLPILLCAAAQIVPAQSTAYHIRTFDPQNAGQPGDISPALEDIRGIAVDPSGNLYVAESSRHRVLRISPSGAVLSIAGSGTPGFSGDNGPASSAQLCFPYGLAADAKGNLYIADLGNARIRRVGPDGVIRTIAGGGATPLSSLTAAGASAPSVALRSPRNVALGPAGDLYFSDFEDHRILRLSSDGRLTITAGTGVAGAAATSAPVTTATFRYPAGLYVDASGAIFVADSANHAIRRISGSTVTVVPSQTQLNLPIAVAGDASQNLYVGASGLDMLVTIPVAGAATSLPAAGVRDVAFSSGVLYCAAATTVQRLDSSGQWKAVSGTPPQSYTLSSPIDVQPDGAAGLLVADNLGNRVLRLSSSGAATVIAGSGEIGDTGDGGPATAARLNNPQGVAQSPGGIYISDTLNHRVRRIDASGVIQTMAGTGVPGYSAESRPGVQSPINAPTGIAAASNGDIYFSDTLNHLVRKLTAAGILSVVGGNGQPGYRGDQATAPLAQFHTPRGLALAPDGTLYVADSGNHRIRKITPQGLVTTVAGTGISGFSGDGGPASEARLSFPAGVALDASGALYIADTVNHRIRRISPAGIIQTVAGTGAKGGAGDDGPALSADLDTPTAVAALAGSVFVADQGNQRIRELLSAAHDPTQDPAEFRILHAATGLSSPVAPGMLVSLTGDNIGPQTPSFTGGSSTGVPAVQVLFDGQPAALLYAQSNLIQAQAPASLSGKTTSQVQVVLDGQTRAQTTVNVTPAAPGLFTTGDGTGGAAAVNEDGTLNGEGAGAARGGLVTVYLTGEGSSAQSLAVAIAGAPAAIVQSGGVPIAPGLLWITVRVPASAPAGRQSIVATVGSVSSQANVTIALK